MKTYKLKIITTFTKYIEYKGKSLEDAIERASSDEDLLNESTDTLDFETEIVEDK